MNAPARAVALPLLILAAVCAAPPPAAAQDGVGNVRLLVGARAFDEDDWEPVDEQLGLGLELDWRPGGSQVGFELGVSVSEEDDDAFVQGLGVVDAEASFLELYGGVRGTFGEDVVQPFVGAGLTYLVADLEVSALGASASEDEGSLGLYAHGGVSFAVGEHVSLGLDARVVLGTEMDFAGFEVDADYFQLGGFLGFGF